jgi:enoyl-CoA hydratase
MSDTRTEAGEGRLIIERSGAVLTLTLNRPAKRNALDIPLCLAIAEQLAAFEADDGLRAMVLTGTDPAFCAGLDFNAFADASAPRDVPTKLIAGFPRHAKPIIGAINGATMTGGLELALGCDFLIASERAIFADTHIKIGLLAGGGLSSRLPMLTGGRFAKQFSLAGESIDAATALRVGLVNEVLPHDKLLARAQAIAATIVTRDPHLVAITRRVIDFCDDQQTMGAVANERRELEAQKARAPMAMKI